MPDAAAYGRVFKKPKRSRDKFFTVLSRSNHGGDARLGLAVAKKHCRTATGRNRIKRIVRESFRTHQDALEGLDVVVLNTGATHRASNAALFDSLSVHWQRCRAGNRASQEEQ